jgi:23S rRNA (uracil1939-C5)-methyltransferase
MIKRGDVYEIEAEDLSQGGKAITKIDNIAVFVDFLIPGDIAWIKITKVKPNFAEAVLLDITSPSPYRIEPNCLYFEKCGGCYWQNLPYEKQLQYKEGNLKDNLERIGKINPSLVGEFIPSKEHFNYRNKVELTFSTENDETILGFHYKGRFDQVIGINACNIASPITNKIISIVRRWAKDSGLKAYNPKIHDGFLRHLSVREAKNTGEVLVNISTYFDGNDKKINNLFDSLSLIVDSFYWTINSSKSDALKITHIKMVKKRPTITEDLHSITFEIGPETFFQTNTYGAEKMIEVVKELADIKGNELVFDVYCGVGTFGLSLAKSVKEVFGVEVVPKSIEAAKRNAQLNGITNANFEAISIEKYIKQNPELKKYDLVIVDPPRSGLDNSVIEAINKINPKKVIYISCNPSTLARDLKEFNSLGFEVKTIIPIDLFPQTYHLETITLLQK